MATLPFGSPSSYSGISSASTSSRPTYHFKPVYVRPKRSLLQQITLDNIRKEEDRGFFGDLKHALGSGVSWTFKQLLRPSSAIAGAALGGYKEGTWGGIFGGLKEGFLGDTKGYGEVLDEVGVFKNHDVLRGLSGFGIDVVTDPLNLLTFGTAPVIARGAEDAFRAGQSTLKGFDIIDRIGRQGEVNRAAAEVAIRETKNNIKLLNDAGEGYVERRALAEAQERLYMKRLRGEEITDADVSLLNLTRGSAYREYRAGTRFRPELRLGPASINKYAKLPMPFTLPKLKGVADAAPEFIGKPLHAVGRSFIAGYENPKLYTAQLMAKHLGEERVDRYFELIQEKIAKHSHIDNDTALDALHLFEQAGGVKALTRDDHIAATSARLQKLVQLKNDQDVAVKGGQKIPDHLRITDQDITYAMRSKADAMDDLEDVHYAINEDRVMSARAEGTLTRELEDFVRDWHHTMEFLRKKDFEFGFHYRPSGAVRRGINGPDIEGGVYVPHLVDSRNRKIHARSLLRERGFTKHRVGQTTVSTLRELRAQGILPTDVETNIFKIAAQRARSGAAAQADLILIQNLRNAMSTPLRVMDTEAYAAAGKRIAQINKGLAFLKHPSPLWRDTGIANLISKARFERTAAKNKKIASLKAEMKKVRHRKDTPQRRALLKDLHRQVEQEQKDWAADMKAISNETHESVTKPIADIRKATDKAAKQKGRLEARLEKEIARQKKAEAGTRVAVPKGMVAIERKIGGKMERFAVPPEIHEALTRLEKVARGEDEAINSIVKGFDSLMANWKLLVTSVNPGYRIRNTMTDMWNAWVAGMPAWAMPVYTKKAMQLLHNVAKGDPDAQRLFQEMYHEGVLSGLFQGDIQDVAKFLKRKGTKAGTLLREGDPIKAGGKVAQDVNRYFENLGRVAHYMYRRQHEKLGISESAFKIRQAHFDYSELTPFEQKYMKRIAPFYTWTRKNVPYQIKAIISRPGRYSAFPKFANEMETAAGGGENDLIPDYMSDLGAFKVPWGSRDPNFPTYFMPQLGVSDLFRITHPNQLKGMVNPIFQAAVLFGIGENWNTGAPLQGIHPRNPVNAAMEPLLRLLPGANFGPTERKVGDTMYQGAGINPKWSAVFGQLPFTNWLFNQKASIKEVQRGKGNAELAYLGGVSMAEVDQEQQALLLELEFKDKMRSIIRGLRDENIIEEAEVQGDSEYELMMRQMLVEANRRGK